MRNLCALLVLLALPLAAEKKAIVPPEFAGGTANFSPGILVDGTLYVSGQIGQDLKTKQVPGDFETEVKTLLGNIGIVLKAAGMTFKDVVSVQVYLTDMDLFPRMNHSCPALPDTLNHENRSVPGRRLCLPTFLATEWFQ